ncbi:uncharacterized protein LOC107368499 [Tetranychus urticae]|uniref:Gustatory receptor n=1 Tax=Tetranychus urticae TaxID=32264 RepID=T1JQZ6_TETUR|nr:uncharacterized protein LOC107368499 [Tetranychus urticae]
MLTKLKTKIESFVENQANEEHFIKAFGKLERIGSIVSANIRGYKQEGSMSTFHHIYHFCSHIWFIIVVARSVTLIVSDDPEDSLYLGDFFSSTKGKNFLHANIIVYYLLFFSSRAALHIADSRKPQLSFQFFNTIKLNGLSTARKFLTSKHEYTWRFYSYIALQFFFIVIPIVAVSLFVLSAIFALENPALYKSIYHFIWYFFWILIVTGPLGANIFTLFWSYTHTMTLSNYLFLAFTSVDHIGARILKKMDSGQTANNLDLIREFIRRQNSLLNLLKAINSDAAPTMWTGYLISCFLADFNLFLGLFIDGGSPVMNIICFALACTAFSNLLLLHLSGIAINNTIAEIREKNFSIQARGVKVLPESIALWINSTQERFENGETGFSCCHIFILTQSSFLFSVLENSGILMMFVANFKKS